MPHGLRKEMYEEVLRLYSQGLGYTRIIRELRARFGVTVSRSTISYWVRGVRTPYYVRRPPAERVEAYRAALAMRAEGLGCKMIARELLQYGYLVGLSTVKDWIAGRSSPYGPKPPVSPAPRPSTHHPCHIDLKSSPDLAYLIGVVLGDGYTCRQGYHYYVGLRAKDREFVEEFARCLSIVLGRQVKVTLYKPRGLYCVRVSSRALYELLKKPLDMGILRQYIEHCMDCRVAFIRGFVDSEGTVHKFGVIYVFNTNLKLLRYLQKLFGQLGIQTTGPRISSRRGTILRDPRSGKAYLRKRNVYCILIRVKSIPRFYEKIGFKISRKQAKIERFVKLRQPLPSTLPQFLILCEN